MDPIAAIGSALGSIIDAFHKPRSNVPMEYNPYHTGNAKKGLVDPNLQDPPATIPPWAIAAVIGAGLLFFTSKRR